MASSLVLAVHFPLEAAYKRTISDGTENLMHIIHDDTNTYRQ